MESNQKGFIRGTVGFVAGLGVGLPFAVVALGILFAIPRAGFIAFVLTLIAFAASGVWLACCSDSEAFSSDGLRGEWQPGDWTLSS